MSWRPGFLMAADAVAAVKPSGSIGAGPAGPWSAVVAVGAAVAEVMAITFRWRR